VFEDVAGGLRLVGAIGQQIAEGLELVQGR